MSDARDVFDDLRDLGGAGFEETSLARDPERLERRVARRRGARGGLVSVAAIAVMAVGYGVWGAAGVADPAPLPIADSPSPSPTASGSETPPTASAVADPAACNDAAVVAGKPVGDLGGLEGWFNSTPAAPCDEWEARVLEHPDTVLIYTGDNTMVEAYYRTDISALGEYADLGPDFVVPNPDPAWPEDQFVLIDALTGEVLEAQEVPEPIVAIDSMALEGPEPWERLLEEPDLMAQRVEDLGSGAFQAPYGWGRAGVEEGVDTDLAAPVAFARADGSDGTIWVRLRPAATLESAGGGELLGTGMAGEGSLLFEDGDGPSVRLVVPVSSEAALTVAGEGAAADPSIVVGFGRAILEP